MVSVTHTFTPASGEQELNLQSWLDTLAKNFSSDEVATVRRACEFVEPLYAGHTELTGMPLQQHALGTAAILAGMNMDYETVTAAILHAVPEHLENWMEKLATAFNANIVVLVLGMSRMEQIQDLSETHGLHKPEKHSIRSLRMSA